MYLVWILNLPVRIPSVPLQYQAATTPGVANPATPIALPPWTRSEVDVCKIHPNHGQVDRQRRKSGKRNASTIAWISLGLVCRGLMDYLLNFAPCRFNLRFGSGGESVAHRPRKEGFGKSGIRFGIILPGLQAMFGTMFRGAPHPRFDAGLYVHLRLQESCTCARDFVIP